MGNLDIVRWAESKIGFYVDRHYHGGQWVLRPGPIRLASYHADILRHIFTPDGNGRLPYDVVCWAEPAKSGKSAIAGLVAQYTALHGEQNSAIILASNKQDQAASVMYKSFAESVRYNPALKIEPAKYEVTFPNGNTVKAIASNSRTEAGARFSLALFDELWGYVREDAERLWTEFKTDPTRLNSLRFATGYAGYTGESDLWEGLLKSGLAGEPVPELAHIEDGDGEPACWANGRTFVFWSHVCRQPWQTEEWLEGQRQTLRPAEFARMIETRFVEAVGNFVDPADWEALIDPELAPLEPGRNGPAVYVGLDLALSPKGDDCALIGTYRDNERERVNVAFHHVWKGKERRERLKLGETVKPYLLRAAHDYNLAGVYFDPWQAQHLADELRAAGVNLVEVPQSRETRGAKDTKLFEMVANRQLALYDHPELRRAAAGASAKELGDGRIFLCKSGGRAKIDLLVALSNCASEALKTPSWLIW